MTQMPCQCLVRLENKTLLAFTTFQLGVLAHVADLHAAPLPLRRKLVLFPCGKRVLSEGTCPFTKLILRHQLSACRLFKALPLQAPSPTPSTHTLHRSFG